jgi:glycosyltransferase involved in cell wall biosynthesis
MSIKKVYIIGSAGIPVRYGGFETYAENISLKLSQKYDVSVICSKKLYKKSERKDKIGNNIHQIYLSLKPNGIFSLGYDLISLILAYSKADFIVMLGTGAGIFLPLFSIIKPTPIAVHVDGIEWKRIKWNRFIQIFLRINFLLSLKFSNYILIDNDALQTYIPKKFTKKIVFTSYGGDHLPRTKKIENRHEQPYALAIARAEPENNIHIFLEAFKKFNTVDLIVISNWTKTRYGRKLYKQYRDLNNIKLIGPIYDDKARLQQYRKNCTVYLHGHSAGGTNPSLVEAMYSDIPIIAFDNDFNRKTTNNLALFFKTLDDLIDKLKAIDDETLKSTALKMQKFAFEQYTWDKAAKPLIDLIDRY